jgi:adenylate cyclase
MNLVHAAGSTSTAPCPAFARSFRAVMMTDVVGYSRLMEAAETETHARYRALRVDVSEPIVISHRGEILKNTGDGFTAVFESPLDALRCAIVLQQEVAASQATLPPERRLMFRIGLHWESVILDQGDVYGGGVNIAARLQSVAPSGGIVVSAALLAQTAEFREFPTDDLGELRLKNLARPVRAFSIRLPGIARIETDATTRPARTPSIAVLPFEDHSPEPDRGYFADGLIEDIIVSLSNLSELLVVSRGSTLALSRQAIRLDRASEKLGVRYVLSGTLRRARERIRLSVTLTDLSAGSVIWAERYDTALTDLFTVQDDIALSIVGKIATHVQRSEVHRALRTPPQSHDAYDHLLQGLDLLYRLDPETMPRARTLLEQAREDDPGYAAPYAYLAQWHLYDVQDGPSLGSSDGAAEVMRLSAKAVDLDPANALALALLGHAHSIFRRDYLIALDLFERALAVSPNNAWAWTNSSATYGFIGEAARGIAHAERAIRLSPIDLHAFVNFSRLGQNYYLHGSYEDAIRWSRKALSLNPRYGTAARVATAAAVALGRQEEAEQLVAHHARVVPRFRLSEYARRCAFRELDAAIYIERLKLAGVRV